ncbi:EAL domain-containing protein [Pseudalkalibacillus caeni]|uniref:EAL domain-containing protein n=1 Tax=Exobacillus caeni TaxID=2574798 RepID=A0A5R9EXD7_9BACL|nr:EAL-associated domain-containing protein [Pseudalkalibacillus caeni]TLS35747.1 EAL domain-containing protein [Pseudalkalibacillus caeni]
MDALDILTKKDHILPFFQPIISADTQTVIGYEVLGRIETESGYQSLAGFFQDRSIPEEYISEVDEHIRTRALQYFVKNKRPELIFFNSNANVLLHDHGESFISSLQSFTSIGLPYHRIVLEVAESDFEGDFSRLSHLLAYIQSLGVQIAIDDIGNGASNLDRIAHLNPDIIKVELTALKDQSMSPESREVLYSLSMLARKIGATLLFEGIESEAQLKYAWENGGRYYQGFFLSDPNSELIDPHHCKAKMKHEFQKFVTHERQKLKGLFQLSERLNERLGSILKRLKHYNDNDAILRETVHVMSDVCFRAYICDAYGVQHSANALKNENGEWILQKEYKGNNWSWRPYFLENIVRMSHEQKGILSDLYSDIEINELIRTYSYPINQDYYLFIDIPYGFLYDQEGLF